MAADGTAATASPSPSATSASAFVAATPAPAAAEAAAAVPLKAARQALTPEWKTNPEINQPERILVVRKSPL